MKRKLTILTWVVLLWGQQAEAQYQLVQKPKKIFDHKVGALWNMITNNGYWGNTYSSPNFEWPGGSGNVYGWRTSLWVGAVIDTIGYTSYGDGNHFVPLDTIQVKRRAQGSLSAEDTYTRYTDVNPPAPSGVHVNLERCKQVREQPSREDHFPTACEELPPLPFLKEKAGEPCRSPACDIMH